MPIWSCKSDYLLQLLCTLDEKVNERWVHVNHDWSHPMTNDKQLIFFATTLCIIEPTCQFLVTNYCD
jgi:hypothetical protein